ncbi:MAG: hypothetical protein C0485_14305 [Pirellula sp.]|nr:hypothetical protein [Pirellula sp.]
MSFGSAPNNLPIFEAPTIYRDELYFSASTNEEEHTRLFKTNGREVSSFDVSPGYAVGAQAIEFQGQLYFRGDDGDGIEPFRTDGHTITNLNLSEGPEGSGVHSFKTLGNNLYFQGSIVDSSGTWQSYLFHTDGIDTASLANTNTNESYPWGNSAGGKFYFPANGPNGLELYSADGREIHQVIDVNPGLGDSLPWPAGELNGEFYFTALEPRGRGLYRTDGENAVQLPFPPDPTPDSGPVNFLNFGGALYFLGKGKDGYELYRTDGGSVTHTDLLPGPESSVPATYSSIELDNKLLIPGRGANGWAVFVINSAGELVNQLDLGLVPAGDKVERGFYDLPPQDLHEFRGEVYFQGTGPNGPDLYKTDGETLTKMELGALAGSVIRGVATHDAQVLDGSLYFRASTSDGFKLVKTDGATTSTLDLWPDGDTFSNLELIGDELVFQIHTGSSTVISATDGTTVRRLAEFPDWATDLGYGYPEYVRSATSFLRFRDELMFLGRTEQGWRLHRIAAVPEPLGIAMVVFALAGIAAMRRSHQVGQQRRVASYEIA